MTGKFRLRTLVLMLVASVLFARWLWMQAHETKPSKAPAPSAWEPEASQPMATKPKKSAEVPVQTSPSSLPVLHLQSPQQTLSTQVELLSSGDFKAFAQTMLVSVSPADFDACQKRMNGVRLYPDWEMARTVTVDGHPTVYVSIFGKSETGFHDINGRYLADALWCLPRW